jgi:hypothetical protein
MEQFLYTIVRYSPLSETGEFANIGIVMAGPETGFFDFRLKARKHKRITDFFHTLTPELYRTGVRNIKDELERMKRVASVGRGQTSFDFPEANLPKLFFQDLLRRREGIIRFGETRLIMTDAPEQEIDRLFRYYVESDFVTPQLAEALLVKEIRTQLNDWGVAKSYAEHRLGGPVYTRSFPFVKMVDGQATAVIKPLSFKKERAETIIEHANTWSYALRRLRDEGTLPGDALVPLEVPTVDDLRKIEAMNEAADMIKESGFDTVRHDDWAKIRSYVDRHEVAIF